MSREIWFIGDEVTAAGFRLAGLHTVVPAPGTEARCLDEACAHSALVCITPDVAQALPDAMLKEARRSAEPLVLIVPDLNQRQPMPDLAQGVLGLLGLEG